MGLIAVTTVNWKYNRLGDEEDSLLVSRKRRLLVCLRFLNDIGTGRYIPRTTGVPVSISSNLLAPLPRGFCLCVSLHCKIALSADQADDSKMPVRDCSTIFRTAKKYRHY
jgi:hypothetical protein